MKRYNYFNTFWNYVEGIDRALLKTKDAQGLYGKYESKDVNPKEWCAERQIEETTCIWRNIV